MRMTKHCLHRVARSSTGLLGLAFLLTATVGCMDRPLPVDGEVKRDRPEEKRQGPPKLKKLATTRTKIRELDPTKVDNVASPTDGSAVGDRETAENSPPPSGTPPVSAATDTPASATDTPPDAPVAAVGEPAGQLPAGQGAAVSPRNPDGSTNSTRERAKTIDGLFQGWDGPQVVLTFSGRQHGYIEPCGCTGLDNQKGGLARRHTFLKHLTDDKKWSVVPMDLGNQVRRFGSQAELKFQISADALIKMEYKAVGFGQEDLQLPIGALLAGAGDDGSGDTLFSSANVALLARELTPTHKIVEAAGLKIGVITFLGNRRRKLLQADEVIHQEALAELKKVVLQLKDCDLRVLLAHADIDETRAAIQATPGFDLVITAGGAQEPPFQPEKTKEGPLLIEVGAKGMFMPTLGYFPKQENRWKYERVPLDSRFADSKDMLAGMAVYQDELKRMGLAGLGLKPISHPSGREFVGSAKCAECHEDAYNVWKASDHAHATDSLVTPAERSEIARHFDPECLSCHVTGWNAQNFFPYESGYLGLESTPLMVGNGCENCHGPGSEHVTAEEGDATDEVLDRLRGEMHRDKSEQACMECHDIDNSPDFHSPGAFEEFWDAIAH
jgi:hypothetical protein